MSENTSTVPTRYIDEFEKKLRLLVRKNSVYLDLKYRTPSIDAEEELFNIMLSDMLDEAEKKQNFPRWA